MVKLTQEERRRCMTRLQAIEKKTTVRLVYEREREIEGEIDREEKRTTGTDRR